MPKSYSNCFETLVSYENICLAIVNASKEKRSRPEVQEIINNMGYHILNIIHILTNELFKPQTHHLIKIKDGCSHKDRFIVEPYFYKNADGEEVYEQIIHHAVVQVLKPIIMKGMYAHSNGSVPDRGCHRGKKYIEKYIKEHSKDGKIKYFIKGDIHHYYQSISIDKLKKLLSTKIKDQKFLSLLYAILDSNIAYYKGESINIGLPIGFYSSQWLANFYLEKFDHYIKETLHASFYSRYMDDFIIFGSNKKELRNMLERISVYLLGLSLKLKDTSEIALFHYIYPDGKEIGKDIDFMGFRFYRNRTTLRKHILLSAKRTALKVDKAIQTGKMNWYLASRMMSYIGWFKHTDTYTYYNTYIAPYAHTDVCRKYLRSHSHKYQNKMKSINKP